MRNEELAQGFVVADKYVVDTMLGRGGMGAVYRVRHATTGKAMAMKCMLPGLVHDDALAGRFLREARIMGRLQHRHVVDVLDVGRDGDILFIVMELLDGKPLSAILSEEQVTLEETLIVLLRAMEGVAAAHEVGVIHRDLKPDNIFVCTGASGRMDDPRVLDFGISKLVGPIDHQVTRSGVAMGTPYYMALEQLKGERDIDARVDVYAMGVLLYEAIAGEPPFQGDSMSAIAIRMLTTEPQALSTLRPDLPTGLSAVIMQAIARDRDDRPVSMRALIEKLKPFVHGEATRTRPSVPLRVSRRNQSTVSASEIRITAAHREAEAIRQRVPSGNGRVKRAGIGLTVLLAGGATATLMIRSTPDTASRSTTRVLEVSRPLATNSTRDASHEETLDTQSDAATETDAGLTAAWTDAGGAPGPAPSPRADSLPRKHDAGASRKKKKEKQTPLPAMKRVRGRDEAIAPTTDPAVISPTPSPSPGPDFATVEGRAGVLGVSEF